MKHVPSFQSPASSCCRMLAAIMICLLAAGGVNAEQSGKEIMEKRCTLCHDIPDPSILSDEQWVVKLETMAEYAGLSDSEKSTVLGYVTRHGEKAAVITSMAQEQRLFERKCSVCHSTKRVLLMQLTPATAAHVVERMQGHAPDLISNEDVHEILEFINHGMPGIERPEHKQLSGGPAVVFRERCTACHTAERVFLTLKKSGQHGTALAWGHIVNRMREKAPDWITDREAEQILKYLESLGTGE